MPNVVLDASTLVGALLKADSVPEKALIIAAQQERICLSSAVLTEIREVFARPRFRPFTGSGRASAVLGSLTRRALFFDPSVPVRDCRDAKDNKYLELALAADAATVISSDQDLLVLDPWRGIRVMTPAEYVRLAGPPPSPGG